MKSPTHSLSYENKDVYIGIDVHKQTYAVVARVNGTIVKRWTTAAEPIALVRQLQKYFGAGRIHTAYEAGFSGFVLHRQLQAAGIDSRVVHAAAVEVRANNRVKTDQRDAARLSEQLAAGRLPGIYVPSEAQEAKRLLSRSRQQLVQERSATKQRIRMKGHQYGLIAVADRREMSPRLVEELLAKAPNDAFKLVIETYWQLWQSVDEQIARLERALRRQAASDPNEARYQSVPGVGFISARLLSNELGDMSQFANERQLFSYLGLTPSEHSSGEHVCRGRITKQGNRHVRGLLLEIAWRALAKDPALSRCFERLWPRTGKTKAIVAVARKLIGKVRAAFRHNAPYQIDYQPTSAGGQAKPASENTTTNHDPQAQPITAIA